MSTNLNEFDLGSYSYHLPESLIAQSPAQPRDSSRLLILDRKTGKINHQKFSDLPSLLESNDLLIANNTQVFKARLLGHRIRIEKSVRIQGGRVEFVMLEKLGPKLWEGLFHASAKYVPGLTFEIPTPSGTMIQGKMIRGSGESPSGTVVVEFDHDPVELDAGEVPLPHYIHRETSTSTLASAMDEKSYQTVYSKMIGSAAAPTAGLHFTETVLNKIKDRGISWKEVTLHVGLGTFRPVKSADIREHVMHQEKYEISEEVARTVTQWKKQNKKIFAVGTTSVRTLESAWKVDSDGVGYLSPGTDRTSIFIHPGEFKFKVVDRLLTNFHLPGSTLLMLVCAFAGRDFAMTAYEEAVREKYRFFSYGDAMLIL